MQQPYAYAGTRAHELAMLQAELQREEAVSAALRQAAGVAHGPGSKRVIPTFASHQELARLRQELAREEQTMQAIKERVARQAVGYTPGVPYSAPVLSQQPWTQQVPATWGFHAVGSPQHQQLQQQQQSMGARPPLPPPELPPPDQSVPITGEQSPNSSTQPPSNPPTSRVRMRSDNTRGMDGGAAAQPSQPPPWSSVPSPHQPPLTSQREAPPAQQQQQQAQQQQQQQQQQTEQEQEKERELRQQQQQHQRRQQPEPQQWFPHQSRRQWCQRSAWSGSSAKSLAFTMWRSRKKTLLSGSRQQVPPARPPGPF
mmetsp:Transcript_7130/g.15669  ORF Transcript_7130/g.15669 Transcript_7130/m.15669 type:complete len:313 (+) Transcript_7130:154-1092(+)